MLLIVSGNGILDLIRNVQSVNALLELKQKYVNVAFFFPVNTVMVWSVIVPQDGRHTFFNVQRGLMHFSAAF